MNRNKLNITKDYLKRKAKIILFTLLYYLTKKKSKGVKAVLLYHSINNQDAFLKQMIYFKRNFRFVLAKNLKEELQKSSDDENIVCCTFDDGDLTNYDNALPVLEKLGIKATFFITAGLLGNYIDGPQGPRKMMNKEQVKELFLKGHEIGAHTMTHKRLPQISIEEAKKEIENSKTMLEDLIGCSVVSFAYPYGLFNKEIIDKVKEAGFKYAFTTKEGLLKKAENTFLLPRIGLEEKMNPTHLRVRISYALELYEKLRGRR